MQRCINFIATQYFEFKLFVYAIPWHRIHLDANLVALFRQSLLTNSASLGLTDHYQVDTLGSLYSTNPSTLPVLGSRDKYVDLMRR